MSKMGNAIVDIQERYSAGQKPEEIARDTKTTLSFVIGVIESMEDEWPEPDPDF